jgi:hypothetical protein
MKLVFLILTLSVLHLCVLGQNQPKSKIWKVDCKDNKCGVLAYVDTEGFNESNMQSLAAELAKKYKGKEVVNFRVFDNEEIIRAYIEGKREPINLLSDSKAYFIHKAECGDMLFYRTERYKINRIKLSWKNTKSCNTPFTVF